MSADLTTFYVARPDGYLWLYHATDPETEGHPVGIEVDAGTTLADLLTAATAHTCEEPTA